MAVRRWAVVAAPVLALALVAPAGCGGPQSALDTAGRDAERIAGLFWWMAGGALVVWAAVVALSAYAIRGSRERHGRRAASWLIVGGGAVLPTVVLLVLLAFGLAALPELLALPPPGGPRVRVVGEEWWWRVRYELPDGRSFELANELRLPVGERVALELESADVIHAFWVPSLAGKVDLIPGRTTWLALEPTRTGTFRGACAEYCGTSHAWMGLHVVALERAAYEAWLDRQAAPADPPRGAAERRGQALFLGAGCGACHAVRGTPADGRVGPDLTHVASRTALAAATLPNDLDALRRWIARPAAFKPGARMPPFGMLPEGELDAIAAWLGGLE